MFVHDPRPISSLRGSFKLITFTTENTLILQKVLNKEELKIKLKTLSINTISSERLTGTLTDFLIHHFFLFSGRFKTKQMLKVSWWSRSGNSG